MPGFSYRAPEAASRKFSWFSRSFRTRDPDPEQEGADGPQQHRTTWGRGIVDDLRSTVGTYWKSEMTNFNTKTVAVSFFLFIAVIAPSITFGAVYAKRTHNYIGAIELLVATAWCGIFYSLVAGMPMVRTWSCCCCCCCCCWS